jgi:leucyl-tRNA synthetase
MEFSFENIEKKWQKKWLDSNLYRVETDSSKPKYYVLDMFPYPSGAGLHVGHPLGYIASDIYSRFKRLKGFNVLHPMGYDAFGLPAEQYAIETGIHPAFSTDTNIKRYKEQLDKIGFSFDWNRSFKTCDPSYYKWTQWIFTELYSHYFDKRENKAESISKLEEFFSNHGSKNNSGFGEEHSAFSAEEWNQYSNSQKAEILMKYRLSFQGTATVNWCEALGTVLSNDEVKDGVSERGGHPVTKKSLKQWFLRITAYADRLLNGVDSLDWPDALKTMQKNWIGKSEGAKLFFDVKNSENKIEIFTTRVDTIFGATFMVLAPEHDLVQEITTPEQKSKIQEYLKYVSSRSERDRQSDVKKITGEFTGAYAIHPITKNEIPIWVAEYVLKDYGTGAIMAVPSDDDRDNSFAKHFGLEIIDVVDKSKYPGSVSQDKLGIMMNSDFLNGMEVKEAIKFMLEKIESLGIGERKINFKLRDANFSRQRYWGEPFPVIHHEDGTISIDKNLPIELPELTDFRPSSDGGSPLNRLTDWVNTFEGKRETDTMPGYAGSSWYFLRYMDSKNEKEFASKESLDYWQDVDLYIGGSEHAVGHLLYSRMWHSFLYDLGKVPTREPFKKLINQGMIQGVSSLIAKIKTENTFISWELKDQYPEHITLNVDISMVENDVLDVEQFKAWRTEYATATFISENDVFTTGSQVEKMSKSKYNVVNPDDIVNQYGADCFRMYEMFLGPIEQSKPWDTKGISGVSSFIRKFWSLFADENGEWSISESEATKEARKATHTCLKKIQEDIERFSFNTCVSSFMICTNELKKLQANQREVLEPLVIAIAPFAPFLAEELWEKLGHNDSVHTTHFPSVNETYLIEDSFVYPICINGKRRTESSFDAGATSKEIEEAVLKMEIVIKWLEGKTPKKVIVVPEKMVNLVV